MRPLLSPAEMSSADETTISAGTGAEVLMDRAGRAVARAAIRVAQGRYGRRVAVVCGRGNNGGDGFVAARVLLREGMSATCLVVGDAYVLKGAAAHHRDRARAAGVRIQPFDPTALHDVDVVVDALFGTGFRGRAEGESARAIEAMVTSGVPIVAVDIPSGVDGSTGAVEGPCVTADVTVAMAAEKLGTALAPGAAHAGYVEVADIGIAIPESDVIVAELSDVAATMPTRDLQAHKRNVGSVAVIAGSRALTGAALLTARGALRMGAGYVTLAGTPEVKSAAAELPEVMCRVVTEGGTLGPSALDSFADVMDGVDAVGAGPGLGTGDGQTELIRELLAKCAAPIVLDADGLNALAGSTDALEARGAPTIITPHPGELGRLLGASTSEIQKDRLGAARSAAERFSCIVVLKGFRTVVAHPDGRAAVDKMGGPELATAGTGDVLTGASAALVAAGVDVFEAAWAGVFVHGLAGRVAGAGVGAGATASDVADALPEARALIADVIDRPAESSLGG